MKKRDLILVIIWMIVIFIMSALDGTTSAEESNIIVNIISKLFNITDITTLTIIVRKLAHFTEYFILGLLLINLFKNNNKRYLYTIIIGVIYAISDEIHQLFVPGRSCDIKDVMIDTLGLLFSLIIIITYKNLTKRNNWAIICSS